MTQLEFEEFLGQTHNRLLALTRTKGVEYAGSRDQLANFRRLSETLGLPPEAILLVYLAKHLDSIHSYIRGLTGGTPSALSEPIQGRIDDALLYLILLRAMVSDPKDSTGVCGLTNDN